MHITASYARSTDLAKGLDTGAEAYLIEPVDPEVLVATIRAVLRASHAEEMARVSAREWEITFHAIDDGVALVDAEGRIQQVNDAMAGMFGREKSALAGSDCTTLLARSPRSASPSCGRCGAGGGRTRN